MNRPLISLVFPLTACMGIFLFITLILYLKFITLYNVIDNYKWKEMWIVFQFLASEREAILSGLRYGKRLRNWQTFLLKRKAACYKTLLKRRWPSMKRCLMTSQKSLTIYQYFFTDKLVSIDISKTSVKIKHQTQ